LAGQHLEQHGAEGPDVGAPVRRLAAGLFRAHVRGRAEKRAGAGPNDRHLRVLCLGRFDPREAEVEHLDETIGCDRDVRGLQIAMHDAVLMGRFQRVGELPRDGQGFVECQRSACRKVLLQRESRDELEDEAGEAVSLFEAEERRDVRMAE
jgi:hypothetical protein